VPIPNPPSGKLHIFDSYVTWLASSKLTFALEGDYVIQRLLPSSAPLHTSVVCGYARYQLTPRVAIAARTEYLSDRGGLFTGTTQAIKENTFTFEQKLADGFLVRAELRRDASNHPYFLTDTLGALKKEQNTAALGLIWWFGGQGGSLVALVRCGAASSSPRPVRMTRTEFRTDWSNQPFFEKKNQQNGATTQPTVLLGVIAYLSPKK
jgi:hypothetical protein